MATALPRHQLPASELFEQRGPPGPVKGDAGRGHARWGLFTGLLLFIVWWAVGVLVPLGTAGFVLVGAGLVFIFQLARRTPMRRLLDPDSSSFATGTASKVAVAVTLVSVPVFLILRYLPTWIDDGWVAALTVVLLGVAYAALRRIVMAMILIAALVTIVTWSQAPQLATTRQGDPALLGQLSGLQQMGGLQGFQDLAVVKVTPGADQPVRLATIGTATATTPMEIGSITKALTGLVIADSVQRGEIRLDSTVSSYLPQLRDSPAGEVTMLELVTHHSGYAEFGAPTYRRAAWSSLLGRNWINTDLDHMMQEVRAGKLASRGSYAYSTLGTATAGQAAAAAAGMSYPQLMRSRLFEPLGMHNTAIQTRTPLVGRGQNRTGLAEQPWVFDGYAPGGGAVSTAADLTVLATALINGTAPGMDALTPIATSDANSNSQIGEFWRVSQWQTGQEITWHNGGTAGYTSYFGLDRPHRTAVIVLSDVAVDPDTTDLGVELLAQRR